VLDHSLCLNTLNVSHVAFDLVFAKSSANLVPVQMMQVVPVLSDMVLHAG